ncbi:MAG: DUF4340 domain-containing protein [Ruminococcus sp.]|nr:DUF4340 domain-containing protein [Ruminococcus sp.]MDE6849058.1 DUF4340 domain-containing protein [Ruminococcus sp.]
MKKVIIAAVALLIVAGGSFGAFLVVKNKSDKETEKQVSELADNVLFSFDSDSITEINFDCPDGQYKAVVNDDGDWKLDNREFSLDQTYMDALLTLVSDFTAETNYGEADSSKKSMYGLENPSETITLSDGTNNYKIYVGNISPTNDYYYIMVEGKNKVYTVDSIQGSVLKASRLMIKSKDLIPYKDNEIKQITVKKDGKTVYDLTFDTETSTWSLPDEYSNLPFDQTAVTSMLTTVTRLEAQQLLDEYLEDLSKYGFDKPAAEVTVKGIDGTEKNILVSSKSDENRTYTYALLQDSNQVQTYYLSDLNFVDYTPIDFLPDSVTTANIYSVTGFDLEFDDIDDSFTMNMTDNILEKNGKEIDIENVETSTSFQNFYNALSILIFTEIDIDASPDNSEPFLTAVYHVNDGTDIKIDLVDAGNDKCYVFKDDVYTGGLIDMSRITGKTSVRSFYNSFCTNAGILKTVQSQPSDDE